MKEEGVIVKLQMTIPLLLLIFVPTLVFSEYQNGDIVFQISRSPQSRAIQLATHSPYSHMGIVFLRNKDIFVLEAPTG